MVKRGPSLEAPIDRPDPPGRLLPADLMCALDWLRRNPDGEVSLGALSAVAGVRPRTLEAHFKEFLGTPPLAWVRNARLARARRELLDAKDRTTVTGVALDAGFSQLGRFADRYRRRFGELPSQTLRAGRRVAASAAEIDDEALRLTWRAIPEAFAVAPDSNCIALELLEQAQRLAPEFALARAMAAWCWAQRSAQHFGSDSAEDIDRAGQLADRALTLSPNDAMVLSLSAGALTLAHRVAEAERLIERAVAIDPNSAIVWVRRGWSSAYLGDSESALREFRTTLHLAPFEPIRHLALIGIGCAHFAAGRYERAAAWAKTGVESFPQSFWAERVVIAAAASAGALAEARRRTRRLLHQDRNLTISVARRAWPFRPDFMDRLCHGLEIAGVPRD
jgi:AraC-like DNA-binding protein